MSPTNQAQSQPATLGVCQNSEFVTSCAHERCGKKFTPKNRVQRFCSPKCRVYAHRAPLHERRNRWLTAKVRDKSLSFDGRMLGSENTSVGRLKDFERRTNHNEEKNDETK